MKRWQQVFIVCAGVTAIITSGYTVSGLFLKVDARYEKAEAAEQKYQETNQRIDRVIQSQVIRERTALREELRLLKVKEQTTKKERERILEIEDLLKDLEGGGKK